jgi:hypothetical protein
VDNRTTEKATATAAATTFSQTLMKKYLLSYLSCALMLIFWLMLGALVQAQTVKPSTETTPIQGYWYDTDSNGFYEFRENGSFIHESKDGLRHEGSYESTGQDQEGNHMFRAKYTDVQSGEERSLFIRLNRDGKSGYVQYKCMKYPFVRSIES